MSVLLEIIPMNHIMGTDTKGLDYEAFTITNKWDCEAVFEAEYRKINRTDLAKRLADFLEGPLVTRRIRASLTRDIGFDPIDLYLEFGGYSGEAYTYRLSHYRPGRHSR